MVGTWQNWLDDEDLEIIEAEKPRQVKMVHPFTQETYDIVEQPIDWLKNTGESMMEEDLFGSCFNLGQDVLRRFGNNVDEPEGFKNLDIKEQVTDSAKRYGYCRAMLEILAMLRSIGVPVAVPTEEDLPEIIKERKPDASSGVLPTVDEIENKSSFEGDYVVVNGTKYGKDEVIALLNDAALVNDELTRKGKHETTKLDAARARFPGKTDDEILSANFKTMTKEERVARSYIRDCLAKKKSNIKTRAALKAAQEEG